MRRGGEDERSGRAECGAACAAHMQRGLGEKEWRGVGIARAEGRCTIWRIFVTLLTSQLLRSRLNFLHLLNCAAMGAARGWL